MKLNISFAIMIFLGVMIVGIRMFFHLVLSNRKLHRQLANDLLDMYIKNGKNRDDIIQDIENPEIIFHIPKYIVFQELEKRFKK